MAAAVFSHISLNSLRCGHSIAARLYFLPTCTHIQQCDFKAAGKKGKGPVKEKLVLPVETDPEKLVKFVCGSHPVKEDRKDIEIKPDSEYPDWLWTLRMGRAPPLEELDKSTKQYWRRMRTEFMRQKNQKAKIKKF